VITNGDHITIRLAVRNDDDGDTNDE